MGRVGPRSLHWRVNAIHCQLLSTVHTVELKDESGYKGMYIWYMIYDIWWTILTCAQKLTSSQLSLPPKIAKIALSKWCRKCCYQKMCQRGCKRAAVLFMIWVCYSCSLSKRPTVTLHPITKSRRRHSLGLPRTGPPLCNNKHTNTGVNSVSLQMWRPYSIQTALTYFHFPPFSDAIYRCHAKYCGNVEPLNLFTEFTDASMPSQTILAWVSTGFRRIMPTITTDKL